MLFLDGAYVEHSDSSFRFRWVNTPTSTEGTQATHILAGRIGHFLERQELLDRDAESSYLAVSGERQLLAAPCHLTPRWAARRK
jgi:hypothetical protein